MSAWQDTVAIGLVLAAAGFVRLAVPGWRWPRRRAAGCGSGCGKCPSSAARPVLQIEASGQVSNLPGGKRRTTNPGRLATYPTDYFSSASIFASNRRAISDHLRFTPPAIGAAR